MDVKDTSTWNMNFLFEFIGNHCVLSLSIWIMMVVSCACSSVNRILTLSSCKYTYRYTFVRIGHVGTVWRVFANMYIQINKKFRYIMKYSSYSDKMLSASILDTSDIKHRFNINIWTINHEIVAKLSI